MKPSSEMTKPEVPEELRRRRQHHGRAGIGQRLAVGVHRAVELEELGVSRESLGKDPVAFAIALASDDFRITGGFGDDLDNLTVGDGANTLRCLVASCTDQFGFGQTFGLHPFVGLLRDFLGEVGPADAHVIDAQAERLGFRTQLITHFTHHRSAFFRQRGFKAAQTVDGTKGGVQSSAEPGFGCHLIAGDGLAKPSRIGDLVEHECVDFVKLTARNLHPDIIQVKAKHPVLDILHGIGVDKRERQLEVEARLSLDALDFTEADDDCLFALVDDKDRRPGDEGDNGQQAADKGKTVSH
jgi:hypothetical protein